MPKPATGELSLKTEMLCDFTTVCELIDQLVKKSPLKSGSVRGSSFNNDGADRASSFVVDDVVKQDSIIRTEITNLSEIQTSTITDKFGKLKWREDIFSLPLKYDHLFQDAGKLSSAASHQYTLHVRVYEARNLMGHLVAKESAETGEVNDNIDMVKTSLKNAKLRHPSVNAYYSIVPILSKGGPVTSEKQQSLTVYGTRNPSWPEEEFVFGKDSGIAPFSHLSLKVFSRDDAGENTLTVVNLLQKDERERFVRLKRYFVHKMSTTGEIDDDGLEILLFDQRVLAYRKCQGSGRFYPARVRRYFPFPLDEYEVQFENAIDTINDIRDLFSLDVEAKVELIRKDGSVDVTVLDNHVERDQRYKKWVPVRQVMPVSEFTAGIQSVMARAIDAEAAESKYWKKLSHKLSSLRVDILSASNLPDVKRPGCIVSLVANPQYSSFGTPKLYGSDKNGELTVEKAKFFTGTQKEERLMFFVPHDDTKNAENNTHWFQQITVQLGEVTDSESKQEREERMAALSQSASVFIRIVDQGDYPPGSVSTKTLPIIGFAKIDIASLEHEYQDLSLRLIPPEGMPLYSSVGSLFVHIVTKRSKQGQDDKQLEFALASAEAQNVSSISNSSKTGVCGLSIWYDRQHNMGTAAKLSRIGHRQMLRSSLAPTENSQIDALHNVLIVVLKRVSSVIKEINLFEDYETLPKEAMNTYRHIHTVCAANNAEYCGRKICELSLEARKNIVVQLEKELLDIAAADFKYEEPAKGASREEWIKARTGRQKAIQEFGGFMMQDRTKSLVLGVPNCFTGQGMISWITRRPPVLWKDKWVDYCNDPKVIESSQLYWSKSPLAFHSDAIQAPISRGYALQWMSALCAAGYVEHASGGFDGSREANKKVPLMEDKADRFYRLREVDQWSRETSRDKSFSPLDLVQEIDCDGSLYGERLTGGKSDASSAANAYNDAADKATDIIQLNTSFSKKLTEHCEGLLGTPSLLSSLLLTSDARPHVVLYPVAEKVQEVVNVPMLWDSKYCIFLPSTKCMYVYENEMSSSPALIVEMTSQACHVAFNLRYEQKDGWFEIVNPYMYSQKPSSDAYEPITKELRDKIMRIRENGDAVLEFKAQEPQLWIQSISRAGVRVDMGPGQLVILKQLNATVLQNKCTEYETEFEPTDLEASFQRLLNAFFTQGRLSSASNENSLQLKQRTKIRNELKKTGNVRDTVTAYFGQGKRLSAQPANPADFTVGALYSGKIVRIRTPFSDPSYRFKNLYDCSNALETPAAMKTLFEKYKITNQMSWLCLPDALRDLFLLYDVEYDHKHEAIVEEGLMRDQIRTQDGDLDPVKVQDRCTDLNIVFSPIKLEECVDRMIVQHSERKPLGCVMIPIKMVSPHRVSDVWYDLSPVNDMVRKEDLGQLRIQIRITEMSTIMRSKKFPCEDAVLESSERFDQGSTSSPLNVMKSLKNLMGPKQHAKKGSTNGSSTDLYKEPSFVRISIKEAKNLKKSDIISQSSDPFVELVLVEKESDKEVNTLMKTDKKTRTLNPKWDNQEFTLGKSTTTTLSDKKAVLLRVRDHDYGSKNEPLGCVKLDIQRDRAGYITELILHHANPDGSPTTKQLRFDSNSRFDLDVMLLPDERAGQSKKDAAKSNKPGEGKLGTFMFAVEIVKNEAFTDPNAISSIEIVRALETKVSAEVTFEKAEILHREKTKEGLSTGLDSFDWSQFVVIFQPYKDSEQRAACDGNSEDLSSVNPPKLSDLLLLRTYTTELHVRAPVVAASNLKTLGKTYDIAEVSHFEVELTSESLGKSFCGRFDHSKVLTSSETNMNVRCDPIKLRDSRGDVEIELTISLHLVGIDRGSRIKRVLSDTFRIVGLNFDSKAVSKMTSDDATNDAQSFLWSVFKCEVPRSCSIADVLLAQVRKMSSATRLHWRYTPQLLWYVFDYVFGLGEKDRVSYSNAVALDDVLQRWSTILTGIEDAKSQLIGHLHGKLTPSLIQQLFTTCDWSGIDEYPDVFYASGDTKSTPEVAKNVESALHLHSRVDVRLAPIMHSGTAVDYLLSSDQFVGATIIKEYADDHYNIAFCSGSKVKDEDDVYFSDDDELPPLQEKDAVFLCPIATENTSEMNGVQQGRVGTVVRVNRVEHPETPVLVKYDDGLEPQEEWKHRRCLDSTLVNVSGHLLHLQFKPQDIVSVASLGEDSKKRDAEITKNYGNGKYDVRFLDGEAPPTETRVTRVRLTPVAKNGTTASHDNAPLENAQVYSGTIVRIDKTVASLSTEPVVLYSVVLDNGDYVRGITCNDIRRHTEIFPSDKVLLGAVFLPKLGIVDAATAIHGASDKKQCSTGSADKVAELWGSDQAIKMYGMLPTKVDRIKIRDNTTNLLMQAELHERDETKPRFVGQCHGFVKGMSLTPVELKKLKDAYEAGLDHDEPNNVEKNKFDPERCFSVLLAPTPQVQLSGCIRLGLSNTSVGLFKNVVSRALNDPHKLTAQLQRLLRAECSISVPLNRKARNLFIPEIQVCFFRSPAYNVELNSVTSSCSGILQGEHKAQTGTHMSGVSLTNVTINAHFVMELLPNDRGSMAGALDDVYGDGARVLKRLMGLKAITIRAKKDTSSIDEGILEMVVDATKKSPENDQWLEIEFTNSTGERDTEPQLTVGLRPLEDLRLSVRDATHRTHEICFPTKRALVEARLRRHLVPYAKAVVLTDPITPNERHSDFGAQLDDAMIQNDPLLSEPSDRKTATARTYDVKFEGTRDLIRLSERDIRTDTLDVTVESISQMALAKKTGAGNIVAEVFLISSDFDIQRQAEQMQMTPFGLTLSPLGEIIKDASGKKYPESSNALLEKAPEAATWTKGTAGSRIVFNYPSIDLNRVASVRIVLKDQVTKSKIGFADVPMKTLTSSDTASGLTRTKDSVHDHVVSIVRADDTTNLTRVVGKIHICLKRVRSFAKEDIVYAKKLAREEDFWQIDPDELLATTLKIRSHNLLRSLFNSARLNKQAKSSGIVPISDSNERERDLRSLINTTLISQMMSSLNHVSSTSLATTNLLGTSDSKRSVNDASMSPVKAAIDQVKHTLTYTKEILEDTALELGIKSSTRLPWSAEDQMNAEQRKRHAEVVTVKSDLATSTVRLRRIIQKLHNLYQFRLVPTIQRLHELDARSGPLNVEEGEQLLRFFDDEVEDLDVEDKQVQYRIYRRLHMMQISQLLSDIMYSSLKVQISKVYGSTESLVGIAHVPFVDLLDQQVHDNEYELIRSTSGAAFSNRNFDGGNALSMVNKPFYTRVRLQLRLAYSECSLLEQAAQVYKVLKADYIVRHKEANDSINSTVVVAQRKRWKQLQEDLEALVVQSMGKMHWVDTPVLLSRVRDVFLAKKPNGDKAGDDIAQYGVDLTERVEKYRDAVVKVNMRWVNLQPKLEELVSIQYAEAIDAHRTPALLEDIDSSVEGFDIVLSTTLKQVREKWEFLRLALEDLVAMNERKKVHLERAKAHLETVRSKCVKGLSPRYAEAVEAVQFRRTAIVCKGGPLSELHLAMQYGLDWRRTHELLLLLDEQCEGYSKKDAIALESVSTRWRDVEQWLSAMVEMQSAHKVDCQKLPRFLRMLNLVDKNSDKAKTAVQKSLSDITSPQGSPTRNSSSPHKLSKSGSSSIRLTTSESERLLGDSPNSQTVESDPAQVQGLLEWYAVEEARLELKKIPHYRIHSDAENADWLRYSKDGKDTRLLISEEDMVFTPLNVRAALEDRGVIRKTPSFATSTSELTNTFSSTGANPTMNSSGIHLSVIPKEVLEEVDEIERALESRFDGMASGAPKFNCALSNPERVAELFFVLEDLGKTELLWKVKHAVNMNVELDVPATASKLVDALELRGYEGHKNVTSLIESLRLTIQKEELAKVGVQVPPTAPSAAVTALMKKHGIAEVCLSDDIRHFQTELQKRGLDFVGDPVYLRGMRIGTQMRAEGTATAASVNTGLGVLDTQIELLRKALLLEALRKRNSLSQTFPVPSRVLGSDVSDNHPSFGDMTEIDSSGDYMMLVERFQQLLIHEAYTKRLANYSALDRCMRALVRAQRDQVVTKEVIALALSELKDPKYRLPAEAFTREELIEAAGAGKIRTPAEEILSRCPVGKNAKAMAYYAAVSYAAAVYQESTSFNERVNTATMRCFDAFPLELFESDVRETAKTGLVVPRERASSTLKQAMNWLLGSDDSPVKYSQRHLTEAHCQRLIWGSAVLTLKNRWFQRGYGWCDAPTAGVGVKLLLEQLLLFEAANKMHMVKTDALLKEVEDKCTCLRQKEEAAYNELKRRYEANLEKLEELVVQAEGCLDNRKLHSEETPALLYAIDQLCIVPSGLSTRHRQAHHVVASRWEPQRKRLEELVKMHKEGTFSVHRTPELLTAMEYHTEGFAGTTAVNESYGAVPVGTMESDNQEQDEMRKSKLDEIRRGQRKASTQDTLSETGGDASETIGDLHSLMHSPSQRLLPLSPRERQMSWKVITTPVTTTSTSGLSSTPVAAPLKQGVQIETKVAVSTGSPRRKSSLGDELKEMLSSPTKWLIGATEAAPRIQPEKFFPIGLGLDDTNKPM